MYYLISQYGWWMLLVFGIGLFVGWLTSGSGRREWGWLPGGLVIALLALLLTVFRLINGLGALWIESGLLMFAAYLAGCWFGSYLRTVCPEEAHDPGAGWTRLSGWDAPEPVRAQSPTAEWTRLGLPGQGGAVSIAAPATMPKVEGEDQIEGQRPVGLMAPRGGKADDLKLIRGIGKQNEGRLHALGVWHFDQIAAWTKENIDWVGSYLAFVGRIEREEWVSQAKALAAGLETDFAKRVKRGEVATSQDDGSLGQGNIAKIEEKN